MEEGPGRLLSLNDCAPWQTTLQEAGRAGHSMATHHFVEIMEFMQLQRKIFFLSDFFV